MLHLLLAEVQSHTHANPLSAFFLVLFQPALNAMLYEVKRRYGHVKFFDTMDIYLTIQQSFLCVLRNPALLRKKEKRIPRILSSTKARVLYACKKQMQEERLKSHSRFYDDAPSSLSHPLQSAEAILDALVRQKVITESEKHLIFETRVKGKNLKEYAGDHPLRSHVSIRQKRSRAERKIRAFLAKRKFLL